MLFAINVPQSKAVSIAFTSLKSMILGLIITITSQQIWKEQQQCDQSILSFISILQIFFLLGVIIDLFAVGYFYLNREFKKIEYYIFYGYHIVISAICILAGLTSSSSPHCYISRPFYLAIAASGILLQANAAIAMIANLFIVLKLLHFGSNLIWPLLWSRTLYCFRLDIALIALSHGLLSFLNAAALLFYRWKGKTATAVKWWQSLCIVSVFMMGFCYMIVLLGLSSRAGCEQTEFFIKLYTRYGLFQLISPILAVIFLRNEAGDPRQGRIKKHNEIFSRVAQHENVDFGAKI